MRNINDWYKKREEKTISENFLSKQGKGYDYLHKDDTGYTSLSKRWKDLYKRARDYYNNDAFKGFYDSYNGTRSTEGYVGNTGRWYDDLDKQRADANEGVEELLAEIDQYSRYYNEDAVKYLRGLITERQKSYNDIMTDAGKFRDHWSQWATEDDYNNALLMSNAAEAYNSGNYDAAEQALKERAEKLFSEYGDNVFKLINSEEYKELLEFEDALKQKKEYDEYEPFWNAIEADNLDAAENFINAKTDIPEDEKANYQSIIDYNRDNAAYLDLVKNEDFEVNSAYKTTKKGEPKLNTGAMLASNGKVYYSDTGYYDLVYDVINGDPEAYAILYNKTATEQGADTIVFGGVSIAHLQMLKPEEKQIFNYIYATQDKDKAYEYISHLENRYLYSRLRQEREEKAKAMAREDPVGSSLTTIIMSPTKIAPFLMQQGDYWDDGELTKDAPYNSTLYTSNTIRQTISNDIVESGKWGEVGSFAYGVGMSMGDFLMATAVSGGNSTYAGLIMGMGAAADTTLSGLDRGLDSDRAFITGTLAGVAEFFTEKMGVDNLLDKALLDKSTFNYVMKNMLSEGIEEGATDLINWNIDGLYDLISGQDKSEWKTAVAKYMDQGYSESEAFGKALGDRAIQLSTDMAAGAVSGGIMGGAGAGMKTISEYSEGKKYKSDPAALIDEALRLDPNNKYAQKLKAKLESGKNVTQAEIGKLSFNEMEATQTALAERDKAAKQSEKEEASKAINAEKRLAGKIEDKETRSKLAQTVTRALTGESVTNTELRRVAQNQAALTLLSKELGLKKDLKVGAATVSDIRNAISSRQSTAARLSSGNILSLFAAQFDMDESAERSLMVNYAADIKNAQNSKPVTPEEYAAVYGIVYGAGKKGMDISKNMDAFTKVLSKTAVAQAYRAGQNAAKNSQNDLQNGTDSDTINTNAQEVQNEQGIHLRDSGERNRGKNTQGQVPGMEGNARQNQSRRKGGAGPRDSEAASLSYDRKEVSAKSLGIKNGLESGKVRLVAEGSETASMKEAKKIAAEHGLNVKFFGGGNLKIASGQKIISARAYIQGNDVYIRADHSGFTSDQLMRHEAGHDMIAKGEINVADVRKLINERFTPEEIDAISKAYAIAYAETGLTSDEIWEEVICDSVAEMNVFEGREGLEASAEMAADFLPDLREATLESRKETTGPPKTQEGKASSEIGDYTKEEYENFGWIRDNDILSAGYWKNFTENFADAVKRNYQFNKTPQGEFIIEVYDYYDPISTSDVVVFAKGTIESPNVTKIIKINSSNFDIIEDTRREIYALERKGIQCKAGPILEIYTKADILRFGIGRANGQKNARYNHGLDTKRRSSEIKANRIVKFHVDEVNETITTTYANGETVTESLGKTKGKASQDLFEDMNEGDVEKLNKLANTYLESRAKSRMPANAKNVVYSSQTAKAYDAIPGDKLTKDQKKVVDVAAQIGRKVIFATTTNADGVEVDGFIAKNGDIYINPNKNVAPMAFVLKHELSHFAQRAARKYQDFKNTVRSSQAFKNWLKDKGLTEQQYNAQIREERAAVGQKLDEVEATAEIISNFVGDMLFGDNNTISEDLIRELKPEQRKTVRDYVRDFFSWIKSKFVGEAGKAKVEIRKLEKAFGAAYRAAVESSHVNTSEEQFSIQEVRGVSGASYGMGVYLDSTLLSDLTEEERIEMVKERIKELGGKSFTAHDSNGNAVEVHIVESKKKYKNAQGKKVPVNRHLTNYTKSKIKQEALVLADELIETASHQSSDPANYPHDWLDNYGTNAWDKWTVFIQDKENTVWEATLQIANSANGDKILYEIHPIKMVEGAAKNSASSTISAEQSGKPNTSTTTNSISNSGEKNNSQNAQNFDEQTEQFSYTPQNEKIEDIFERIRSGELSLNDAEKLLKKPEGDNPVSIASLKKEDMGSTPDVHKKTKGNAGGGDSRFAESVKRSSIFDEDFKKEVAEDNFVKHYAAITNKETLAEAAKRLDQGGEAFVTEWLAKKAVHMDTVDTMVGFILLKRYQDVGNYEGATAVAQKIRDVGMLSGQRVQAFSIIGRFDADMMQAYAQKELDKAWELAIEGRSDAWIEKHREQFKLTDEDVSFIRDNIMYAAKTPENSRERAIALAQITTLIQNKIPPTRAQSFKAWQRVSMLLNPKTQIRNVLGNAMMAPVFVVSDWFSTPVDILISKATGTRTTGLTGVHGTKANLKAMGKGFAESYDDWKRHINTKAADQNRFEIGQGKSFDETKWGRIAKIMNGFDRFTSFLLDAGDRPFYEAWFMNSLNEQMRLNNVTEPTEAMVQIAVDEALARTWQDENRMTKLVSGIKKAANQISIAGYGMGDVLIKFTKTPANLTKAIYDFSPAAIATLTPEAIRLTKAIKNGTATPSMQKKFVSNFGKMAAGTMLYVAFAALYAAGRIKGSSDEDKDVAAFEKYIQGIPEYSIKIGDKWYSYDWAQPIGAVPAVIADYMESREEGSGAVDSVINAFKAGGEVLFNQSFMTSFKTLFSAESFSEGLLDIILGEITVPIPTVFSQLANVLDEKRRVTYDGTSEFKSALNRALMKIPGIRNLLEAEIDVLGREVDNSQKSWFNAFFNPANVYTDTSTKVTDHAYEIYQSTGDVGAIPAKAPYSVKLQGKNIKLDDAQRAQYQRAMGETASDLIEILLENDVYKAMNDEEKLSVLKQVYSYSASVAKDQLDWADDYEVISGIAPYITEKDFNAMSEEERYKIVSDYIFSDYEGMEDIDSDLGQSNFIINKKVANLVLSATLIGDVDKAVELIDGIESRVESYGWDEDDTAEEVKDRKTSVKTAVTRYWKEAYLYAYYKNDIERQDKIFDMLVKLGLYGDRNDVEEKLAEWVEAYEEENQ